LKSNGITMEESEELLACDDEMAKNGQAWRDQ
jgi:hypothetical protein